MEPIFVNQYHATFSMFREFGRKHAIGPRMPVCIFCGAVYLGLFVLCLCTGILADMAFSLVLMGIFFAIFFFMPHIYAFSLMSGTKKQNDDTIPRTVVTFGDVIEMDEGMVHLTIEYRKIRQVVHLKHSYVLMLSKRTGVVLDPNGFTKGNFAAFKAFLRKKRPDLKIPE